MINLAALESNANDTFDFDFEADPGQEQPEPEPEMPLIEIEPHEPEPTEEESIELQRTRLIMKMYLVEFPEKLKNYKKTNFDDMDMAELMSMRREFEMVVGLKTTLNSATKMVIGSINALENIATATTPINPTGTTSILANDQDFVDDVKLMCLKRCGMFNRSPEVRVAMSVVSTMFMMHKINTMNAPTMNQPADNIIQEPDNDLFGDL